MRPAGLSQAGRPRIFAVWHRPFREGKIRFVPPQLREIGCHVQNHATQWHGFQHEIQLQEIVVAWIKMTHLLKTETWSRSRPGTMSTSAKNTTTVRSHVNGTMCTRSGHFAKTFSDFKKINSPSKELSQELFHKTPCTSSKYDPPSTSLSHCKSL